MPKMSQVLRERAIGMLTEGLRGSFTDLLHPLGGQSVGRHSLVTCFLQRLRPPARELWLCGGSGCYSIALSPLLSPFLGIKTHFSDVGLRDAGPANFSHLWPFFLSVKELCSIHNGQGFASLVAWASRCPSVLGRSSSSHRGTS